MIQKYIGIGDITLTEERVEDHGFDTVTDSVTVCWIAEVDTVLTIKDGSRITTGARVEMTRSGQTAEEALAHLVNAIQGQGWEVVGR